MLTPDQDDEFITETLTHRMHPEWRAEESRAKYCVQCSHMWHGARCTVKLGGKDVTTPVCPCGHPVV